jgi:aryl-alcohol dehydrogenase-like predicted oxidoreductase
MKLRDLGKTGIAVSPLCFGGNVLGWTIDEKKSFEVLDAFIDSGCNFIDTADYYPRWAGKAGESERIIGKWMKARGNRGKIILATKVGKDLGEGRKGLSSTYIAAAVSDSLKRLQTDYIDLYQSHEDDLNTPLEETMQAFASLVSDGKVRAIGASNYSAARLKLALEISAKASLPAYSCLQPLYNLCERKAFEDELQQVCVAHNISVIPYYALASGFLTGKYRSREDAGKSVRGSGVMKYLNEKGYRILAALDKIAASHNANPAAVALAWLMTRPAVTAPIASATSVKQVKEITAAVRLTLSDREISMLDEASRDQTS